MRRLSLLVAVFVTAAIAGAPSTDARGVCHGRQFTMHQFLRYARKAMPVPTKGQLNVMAIMAHCLWAPRLRAVARSWQRRHMIRLGEHHVWDTTAYSDSACDGTGGGRTTSMGTHVHFGEVAVVQGTLSLGSWIYLDSPIHGKRLFRVEDHIGSGSSLDIYLPCEWDPSGFGRQQRGFRVVR